MNNYHIKLIKQLLIIFSLFLLVSCEQEKVEYEDLVYRDGLYYEKFIDKPFTGKVTGINRGKVKNGKKNGEWLYYFNGQLAFKKNYKDGKREGQSLTYHPNGQLNIKTNFKDDKLDGEYLYFYGNGQLWFKGNYKDGKREGEWLHYRSNGKFRKTEIYKKSKLIEKIEH